jgi:hypothetical protein
MNPLGQEAGKIFGLDPPRLSGLVVVAGQRAWVEVWTPTWHLRIMTRSEIGEKTLYLMGSI